MAGTAATVNPRDNRGQMENLRSAKSVSAQKIPQSSISVMHTAGGASSSRRVVPRHGDTDGANHALESVHVLDLTTGEAVRMGRHADSVSAGAFNTVHPVIYKVEMDRPSVEANMTESVDDSTHTVGRNSSSDNRYGQRNLGWRFWDDPQGSVNDNDKEKKGWMAIWRTDLSPNIVMFLWRCAKNIIPVYANLAKRGIEVIPICPRCTIDIETTSHALVECPWVQDV